DLIVTGVQTCALPILRYAGEVWDVPSLDRDVVVDLRVRGAPAPQVEEALAFHRQLEPPLILNGLVCLGRAGKRQRIQADSVFRPDRKSTRLNSSHDQI